MSAGAAPAKRKSAATAVKGNGGKEGGLFAGNPGAVLSRPPIVNGRFRVGRLAPGENIVPFDRFQLWSILARSYPHFLHPLIGGPGGCRVQLKPKKIPPLQTGGHAGTAGAGKGIHNQSAGGVIAEQPDEVP